MFAHQSDDLAHGVFVLTASRNAQNLLTYYTASYAGRR